MHSVDFFTTLEGSLFAYQESKRALNLREEAGKALEDGLRGRYVMHAAERYAAAGHMER